MFPKGNIPGKLHLLSIKFESPRCFKPLKLDVLSLMVKRPFLVLPFLGFADI